MKCDELRIENACVYGPDAKVYLAEQVDAAIAELKDKCQMHDFFWEGCGFAKRGFKNTIAVSEAFDRIEAENAELNQKLEGAKNETNYWCNNLKVFAKKKDAEIAELKQKLSERDAEIESLKASHYAEMVDAGMRERRLNRALWLKRADDAKHLVIAYENYDYLDCQEMTIKQETARTWMTCKLQTAEEWVKVWKNVERKCRAKAEEYK